MCRKRWRSPMVKRQPNETILMLIWIQALIATVGSLFYSEVMGYVPCDLCWIQRIFMYPLVIIYGIAALKKDLSVALSGVILSGIDRKSTRLNSSHVAISYAVFCLKKT